MSAKTASEVPSRTENEPREMQGKRQREWQVPRPELQEESGLFQNRRGKAVSLELGGWVPGPWGKAGGQLGARSCAQVAVRSAGCGP